VRHPEAPRAHDGHPLVGARTDPAEIVGCGAGVLLAALARDRGGRPMHPRGDSRRAVLDRHGLVRPVGVPWLDERGRSDAVVRLSRAVGLPAALPDVLGLALRAGLPGQPVDLLLSTTGLGPLTRAVLVPRRDPATAYASVMTYRSPRGRVSLLAVANRPLEDSGGTFDLAVAFGRGSWEPYALLEVGEALPTFSADPVRAFDAVRHAPPGLAPDGVLARARTPAYAAVRAARAAVLEWPVPPSSGEVPEAASGGTVGV